MARGTPVYDRDEVEVGSVDEVRDLYRERILDGIVIRTADGERRFVDAPEVARTAERAVTLTIAAAELEQLPIEPPKLVAVPSRLGQIFRRKRG